MVPLKLCFQQVLQGCEHMRSFELINIGDSFINSTFKWWPEGNCNQSDIEVHFKPPDFSLKPGDKLLVSFIC